MIDDTLVYFAQSYNGGPIKIGRSRTPQARIRALQVGSPAAIDLVCAIPGGELLERRLHDLFADGRLHGEWFNEDTPALAETIEIFLNPDLSDPVQAEVHYALGLLKTLKKTEPAANPAKATAGSDKEGAYT